MRGIAIRIAISHARSLQKDGLSILIPDMPHPSVLGSTRFLARIGHRVDWATPRRRKAEGPSAATSRYVRAVNVVTHPLIDSRDFCSDVASLVRRNSYDAVLPFSQAAAAALARWGKDIPRYWPEYPVFDSVNDKIKLYEVASDIPDIRLPKVYRPEEAHFPCIVKAHRGGGGAGLRVARSEEELESALRDLRRMKGDGVILDFWPPLIQEFVPGPIHDCAAFYWDGSPKAVLTQKRLVTFPAGGGVGAAVVTTREEGLKEMTMTLLERAGWQGPCLVEWKLDERDGRYTLVEVNPRFWGTLELSLDAGVPIPLMAAEAAAGLSFEPVLEYPVGIGHRWIFPRELYSCLGLRGFRRVGEAGRSVLRFLDPRFRYSFDPSDISPDALRFRETMRQILRTCLSGAKTPWELPLSDVSG